VFTFHVLEGRDDPDGPVQFNDSTGETNVSMTIDVDEYERRLGPLRREREAAETLEAVTRPPPQTIGLFKRVGEVLLTCQTIAEISDKVIALALEYLPVQRGAICLCDPQATTIVPQTVAAKGLIAGEPIGISRSIAKAVVHAKQALLVSDAASDVRFARAESLRRMNVRSAMCAPLYHAGQVQGLIYVDTCDSSVRLAPRDLELLTALGGLTAVGIQQARLREAVDRERAIRARLSRYSSPAVVEQIIGRTAGREGEMVSELRRVSVLFGDLSDFTPRAEGMEPAEIAGMLNGVFELSTDAVFEHEGTLDKYMGDAVMAVFGAPLPQPDHAQRAVRAALRMQRLLEQYNAGRPHCPPLQMRIGINSGPVVAGDIGSPTRKEYTVIGDAVNAASRLESSVAEAGQIVIGPETHELCRDEFVCRPLPEIQLKGKQHRMRPYLVIGPAGDSVSLSGISR